MLKNKILILFIITLIFSCFFSCSVYATEENLDTFNFTGFDEKDYSLPILPDELKNYNHYVLVEASGSIYLICFNESINIVNNPGLRSVEFICDPESSYYYAVLYNSAGGLSSSWSEYTNSRIMLCSYY